MQKKILLIPILVLFLLSSCFKKEDPITLPIGNTEITTLFLGDNYENDMYFDLGTNTYQQKQRADWDLRFETGDKDWGVFINTGNDIKVRKLGVYNLDEKSTFDTTKILQTLPILYDAPDGNPENSAFKDWREYKVKPGTATQKDGIYLLELNHGIGHHRFKRLQIQSVSDSDFVCIITDLYNASGDSILGNNVKTVIKKNKNQNYTYLSFKGYTHIVMNQEPDKSSWDFVFTRYIHFFPNILPNGDLFPYPVTGVMSNRNKVKVAKDSTRNFNDISGDDVYAYTFTTNANAIGYDWKSHAFGPGGPYTVDSKITFIICDTEGNYYKLRFLDFNNSKGEKGYPKFEYVRIK